LIGITIDWFSNSMGLHASATVLLGFVRSPVMKMITLRESEQTDFPGLKQTGLRWFLIYTGVLVVIHHFFLFFTEVFTFDNFFRTLLRSIASSVFTIIVILFSQYLVFKK